MSKPLLKFLGWSIWVFGIIIGVWFSHFVRDMAPPEQTQAQQVVTVTAEPEVVVDTVTVHVVELPDACADAIGFAQDMSDSVGPISQSMSAQYDLMSQARLALNGSNYITMGEVMRDQDDLESSTTNAYIKLASVSILLDDAQADCAIELGE